MIKSFSHRIVRKGRLTSQTVYEFGTMVAFGKCALLEFRTYVRERFTDAKIETPFKSDVGFRYRLSSGDTLELE
jgi:hypothetical protein